MIAVAGIRTRAVLVLMCLAASLVAVKSAAAQKDKCDVDDDNSSEALAGRIYLQRASDPKAPAAQRDSLYRQAVGQLGGVYNYAKEPGRDFLLAYALLQQSANDVTKQTVGPRSSFGYKDNGSGQIDILATADTLMNAMVKAKPACAKRADDMRLQAYAPITNASMQALNSGNYGAADTLSQRAEQIMKTSPYVYSVIGGVAIQKKDYPAAMQAYQQVVTLSGSDTNLRRLKNQGMYNMAVVSETMAEGATGPDKKAKSDSAVAAWRAYVAANPSDMNGQAGLTHALQASGDSAAAGQLYADMLANPDKFTSIQLFQAGAAARQGGQFDAGYKLTQLGLNKNPYYRDGLLYVVSTDFNNGKSDSLILRIKRLISIDPNSPDDYRLLVGAYQLMQKQSTDPKVKKAYGDSVVAVYPKYHDPKVKVSVTKLAILGDSMTVGGQVMNLTTTAQTYNLKLSFIDARGTVISTKDLPPLSVPASSASPFEAVASAPGAVSYKYAPLD